MNPDREPFSLGASGTFVPSDATPRGTLVGEDDAAAYRIDDVDGMPPFFMSVVSGGNRWLFASSGGGMTAGRRDPDGALFGYETDDRLLARDGSSGSRSVLFVTRGGRTCRWEPWLRAADGQFETRRSLWKSLLGDELGFEETNVTLGLTLRVVWRSGERFGFQRRVELQNDGSDAAQIRLLDGVVDLLPADVDLGMQANFSTLVDAYKLAECAEPSGLAVFRLSSIPIDRAIPNEALRANVAWCRGLPAPRLLLSTAQLDAFRAGATEVADERMIRARPGALLVASELELAPAASHAWVFGLDGGLDAAQVDALAGELGDGPARTPALDAALDADLAADRARLRTLVAAADGYQRTGEPRHDARQVANVLFNVMRGGTFLDDGAVDRDDFARFVGELAPRLAATLDVTAWPERMTREDLVARVRAATSSPPLERLAREYLPLTFSRRHGDPSRPWNRFTIDTADADGNPRLNYEGNWRDIFQNWEALLTSYPEWVEASIVKFVNCSTADGYNPYRVTRTGVDWEVLDPHDPWAYIGYWGDHQIVYLQRLLGLANRLAPGRLAALLDRPLFVFVNVPYRIAGYDALLADPRETISFDDELDASIAARVAEHGNEARLLPAADGEPLRVTLAEKLLIPVLAKLSHFVPGLGIWLDTQRPEWNDANNALVGNGVSVVTTAQLVRHLEALRELFAEHGRDGSLTLTDATATHLAATRSALDPDAIDSATHEPTARRHVLDALGRAGEDYRNAVYGGRLGDRCRDVEVAAIDDLLTRAHAWLVATLRANRRDDGLWHAYNTMHVRADGGIDGRRLALMLEGQVAALASGVLSPADAVATLDALRTSALRRDDVHSYVLYPDRDVPAFRSKGVVDAAVIEASPLLTALAARGVLLRRGPDGTVRFAAELRNADALRDACANLRADPELRPLFEREPDVVAARYEATFDHASFTGRSGSFFAYEGLGSVYWHMVSKLRLAVAELLASAEVDDGIDASLVDALRAHYVDIRDGLGIDAPPAQYGAIPTDPYSHTPAHAGAQQPGMTGQVKEDVLARWLELGVRTTAGGGGGRVAFTAPWPGVVAVDAEATFTLCGTPIRTAPAGDGTARAVATFADGSTRTFPEAMLDESTSRALFARDGTVARVDVAFAT